MDKTARFLRQIDILKPEVTNEPVFIIGAGATGSFTALALAKMGFGDIRIFDEDCIEEHKFQNQLFPLKDKGINKALAVKELVSDFTGETITANPIFYKNQLLKGIVISALDNMEGRKKIYKNAIKGKQVKLLIDPRTGPEVFRLLTVNPTLEGERKKYEKTLHTDAQADEAPCTGRSIIYSVLMVSAYICRQIKLFAMNQEYKRDIILDIKNDYLIAT